LRDLRRTSIAAAINWDNRLLLCRSAASALHICGASTPASSWITKNPWRLLQISEPGQSPDPHQRRIAVGIDLGTTHSLVAAVRNGVAECLPDEQGRCCCLRWCAPKAGARSATRPGASEAEDAANTIVSVKRFMGRGLADIANAAQLPYALEQPEDQGMVALSTRAGARARWRSAPRSWPRCATAPKTV
jgi:hypothetical protein